MECGGCTACCTLLPIDPIDKPLNTTCPYSTGSGCSIWETKPQTCTDFQCAYREGHNVPEALRPDKCGIIFIKRTDRIFTGALMPDMEVSDIAKGQIESFKKQGYSVILVSVDEKEPYLIAAEEHDSAEIMKEYIEALNGNI